jgi:hypothetical protein
MINEERNIQKFSSNGVIVNLCQLLKENFVSSILGRKEILS